MSSSSPSNDNNNNKTVEAHCLEAMNDMQRRGLHSSASWLGEMLLASPPSLLQQQLNSNNNDQQQPSLVEPPDTPAIKLAESYLHNQEYKRCTSLLKNEPGFRASFLGLYALYLDGEKQKDVAGASDFAATERSNLMTANAVNGGGGGAAAGGAGGGGGGSFAADHQFAVGGGVSSATFGLFSSASGIHSDIPSGLRKNHHAADLDRALTSLISFQFQDNNNNNSTTRMAATSEDGEATTTNNNNNGKNSASSSASCSPHLLSRSHHCVDHAYLHWLHGVVRRERGLRDEAASSFVLAISLQPLLWTAWVDLVSVINTTSEINSILEAVFPSSSSVSSQQQQQPLRWIGRCFSALAKLEMQHLQSAVTEYEQLVQEFPQSAYLQSKLGCARYHRKDFPSSREAFENAIICDPLRLDGLDDFSSLLFVVGDRPRLASLAQSSYSIDPFRAETSCVAGNYFAMLRRHAQSVQHFRRAVTIDRKNSSAWTLLGHGYVEIKHTSAAVDAYNTAVEVDRRDYRAWYGLGQIFELLHLYPQALEFYRQTAAVRPHDSRMWNVIAGCLEKQSRQGEAIQCLERAEACEPSSTEFYCTLVRKLAKYYSEVNKFNSGGRGGSGSSGAGGGPSSSSSSYHPDLTQKSATYFNKLLQSPFSSTEDRISALLFISASKMFESFELLDVVPRNHSSIFSLQQKGHISIPVNQNNNNNNMTRDSGNNNDARKSGNQLFADDDAANNNNNDDAAGDDNNNLMNDNNNNNQQQNNNNNGGRSGNNNNGSRNSNTNHFRALSLPQIVGNYYFGRSHPHTSNRSSAENRKTRAGSLVQETDSLMRSLRDELVAAGTLVPQQQQQADDQEGGNNNNDRIFVGTIPQELQIWLEAYEHDLEFLRQYF